MRIICKILGAVLMLIGLALFFGLLNSKPSDDGKEEKPEATPETIGGEAETKTGERADQESA